MMNKGWKYDFVINFQHHVIKLTVEKRTEMLEIEEINHFYRKV